MGAVALPPASPPAWRRPRLREPAFPGTARSRRRRCAPTLSASPSSLRAIDRLRARLLRVLPPRAVHSCWLSCCASPAVLPPILEIAQFIATLREMPFSASDAMIGLFISASMIVLAGFRVLAHACGETPGDAAATPESWCLYLISATARRGEDGRALAPPPGSCRAPSPSSSSASPTSASASASSASAAPTARPRTFSAVAASSSTQLTTCWRRRRSPLSSRRCWRSPASC